MNASVYIILYGIVSGLLYNILSLRSQNSTGLLFLVFLYLGFFILVREKISRSKSGIVLWVRVLLLAAVKGLYMNDILLPLSNICIAIGFFVSLLLLTKNHKHSWREISFVKDRGVYEKILLSLHALLMKISSQIGLNKTQSDRFSSIVKGVIIAIPVSIVILVLLSSADPLFAKVFSDIPTIIMNFLGGLKISEIVSFLIVFMIIAGGFYFLKTSQGGYKPVQQDVGSRKKIEHISAITFLVIINCIYLVFCFIQLKYLFGQTHLPDGFTYSQYAVQGFWQLVFINLFNIGILLSTLYFSSHKKIIDWLLVLLFSFNLIIFISALFKLKFYFDTYGFTVLRVLALSFMVLLIIYILASLIKIVYKKLIINKIYIVSFLIFYVSVSLVNVATLTVDLNLWSYQRSGKIDKAYLSEFGYFFETRDKLKPFLSDPVFKEKVKTVIAEKALSCIQSKYGNLNLSCQIYKKEILDTFGGDIAAQQPSETNTGDVFWSGF